MVVIFCSFDLVLSFLLWCAKWPRLGRITLCDNSPESLRLFFCIMANIEMAKDIHLQMWKSFAIWSENWKTFCYIFDFPLHYYSTPEHVLCVQRCEKVQGTRICCFGPLLYSQIVKKFKKLSNLIKILFSDNFSMLIRFWIKKQQSKPYT